MKTRSIETLRVCETFVDLVDSCVINVMNRTLSELEENIKSPRDQLDDEMK